MKRVVFPLAAAVIIPATAGIAFAQGDGLTVQPDGAELWRASCGYCHGGPMNAPELRGRNLPVAVTRQFVRNGAPGMPPFHPSALRDDELEALAQWIAAAPAPGAGDNS